MQEFKFKAIGTVPLLMHCNQAANPLNKYAKYLKPLTSKRNKTEEDHREIARVEWEAGLYLKDGVVALPAENLDRCLWDAAKRTKNGKKFKEGAMIGEDYFPLDYRGLKIKVASNGKLPNPELDKFFEALNHQALVKVGTSTTLRTRPIFQAWSFSFTVLIDENVLDGHIIKNIVKTAGSYIGLCEKRPRLGRFEIEVI
jgi:hypothetical protein